MKVEFKDDIIETTAIWHAYTACMGPVNWPICMTEEDREFYRDFVRSSLDKVEVTPECHQEFVEMQATKEDSAK